MANTAHRSRSVFERYNIVSDGDLKEAARKLDNAMTTQTATTLATLPNVLPLNPLN
jgi:hypothetical protein